MRFHGSGGVTRRKYNGTTRRDPTAAPPGLGGAHLFTRSARDNSGSPISPTSRRGPPSCTWRSLEVCTRRIVGWAMGTSFATDFVLDALHIAVVKGHATPADGGDSPFGSGVSVHVAASRPPLSLGRRPAHDGLGRRRLRQRDGPRASSRWLKCELLDSRRFHSCAGAKLAVFDWTRWQRTARGQVSPPTYERRFAAA